MNVKLEIDRKHFLGLFLLSMCFQNIEIINFGGFGLKLFHIFSILFIPVLLKNYKEIRLPPAIFTFLLYYFIFISSINIIKYGFHSLNYNYIFSYYLLVILFTLFRNIEKKELEDIIKNVAILALLCVCINAFIHRNIIIRFFKNPFGHPVYKFVFGGGANLEATWIGMFGLFFKGDKRRYFYNITAAFISIILASRVGIIINVLSFIFITFGKNEHNKIGSKNIIIGSALLLLFICISLKSGIINYLLLRLESIGVDTGSTARLRMWGYVFEAFKRNPFGYGLGNSIKAINTVSYKVIREGNIHNLYFQMLLDAGIIGLVAYLYVIFRFVKEEFVNILSNPVVAFILVYFILGLVQFRGGDALFYFIVGIYLIEKEAKNKNEIKSIKKSIV